MLAVYLQHPQSSNACVGHTSDIPQRIQARAGLNCDPCPTPDLQHATTPVSAAQTASQPELSCHLHTHSDLTSSAVLGAMGAVPFGWSFWRKIDFFKVDCLQMCFKDPQEKHAKCTSVPFLVSSTTHLFCYNLTSKSLYGHLSETQDFHKET